MDETLQAEPHENLSTSTPKNSPTSSIHTVLTLSPENDAFDDSDEDPLEARNEAKVVESLLKRLATSRNHYQRKYTTLVYSKNEMEQKFNEQLNEQHKINEELRKQNLDSDTEYLKRLDKCDAEIKMLYGKLNNIRDETIEYCHTNTITVGKFYSTLGQELRILENVDGVDLKENDYWRYIAELLALNMSQYQNANVTKTDAEEEHEVQNSPKSTDKQDSSADNDTGRDTGMEEEVAEPEMENNEAEGEKEQEEVHNENDSHPDQNENSNDQDEEMFESASDGTAQHESETSERIQARKCVYCLMVLPQVLYERHLLNFHKVTSPKILRKVLKGNRNKRTFPTGLNFSSNDKDTNTKRVTDVESSVSASGRFVKPPIAAKRNKRKASTSTERDATGDKKKKN